MLPSSGTIPAMDPATIIGLIASIIGIGGACITGGRWLRSRRRSGFVAEVRALTQISGPFNKEEFRIESTALKSTAFSVEFEYAGAEARAVPGAVAISDNLAVKFQDSETSAEHVGLWLTIENRGQHTVRWFGPTAMCYPDYVEVAPDHGGDPPAHFIADLYAGEQVTAFYRFTMAPPAAVMPKYITCRSGDDETSFWWARGA